MIRLNGAIYGNVVLDSDLAQISSSGFSFSTKLLYALAVEPLAIAIRAHSDIRGLHSGQLVETISLYADDKLLCLEDAGPSLQAALRLIKRFRDFSGLQINWGKSKIIFLDIGAPNVEQALLAFGMS